VDPDGGVHAPGEGYPQTVRCIEIIRDALEKLGASLSDVVRTRLFVTDIARWEEFARGHREAFGEHPPTTAMVEVRSLIHPDMLIEIEAEAVLLPEASRD
jgi:isochorismate pyruvate lyase